MTKVHYVEILQSNAQLPRRGIVGSVTVFYAGGLGSIPGKISNFNSYLGSRPGSIQSREDNELWKVAKSD
mgnify:CR=1 FL=1